MNRRQRKTAGDLYTAAILALLLILGLAFISRADEPQKPARFTLEPVAKPEKSRVAGELDSHPSKGNSAGASTSPTDLRPAIRVYTLPNEGACPPCNDLKRASLAAGFPYRLDWSTQAPEWVTAFPTLHWQGRSRIWRQIVGWQSFNLSQIAVDPPVGTAPANSATAVQSQAASADVLAKALQFAGPGGTFTFQPDQPIQATMDDGTKISYSRLSGRYSITAGSAVVRFDQPLARIDARKFKVHFGTTLDDMQYPDPNGYPTAGTGLGRYPIKIELGNPSP